MLSRKTRLRLYPLAVLLAAANIQDDPTTKKLVLALAHSRMRQMRLTPTQTQGVEQMAREVLV